MGQGVWVVGEEDPRILSGWMTFEMTFRDWGGVNQAKRGGKDGFCKCTVLGRRVGSSGNWRKSSASGAEGAGKHDGREDTEGNMITSAEVVDLVKGSGLYLETKWVLWSHLRFLEDLSVCSRKTDKRKQEWVDALWQVGWALHLIWTEMRMTWMKAVKGKREVGILEWYFDGKSSGFEVKGAGEESDCHVQFYYCLLLLPTIFKRADKNYSFSNFNVCRDHLRMLLKYRF